MMGLREAVRQFEADFERVEAGLRAPFCQTGESYIVAVSGLRAPQPEGGMVPVLYASAPEAVVSWLDAARACSLGRSGTLYWRTRPEAREIDVEGRFYSTVWSRFWVSRETPVIQMDEAGREFVAIGVPSIPVHKTAEHLFAKPFAVRAA